MKDTHTDITIVLDRSGSMATVADDTIGGFNRFLEDQKNAPGTADITLHQFDWQFETVMDGKDVKSAPALTRSTFVPRGSTSLLDAMGRAIFHTGTRLSDKPEHERGKVVVVIITDGYENSSKEFTMDQINEMITHQREKYSWEFVFLGANQDAIATASRFGIAKSNSMTYAHNPKGTTEAIAAASRNLSRMRSGKVKCMAFTGDDYKTQTEAGVTKPPIR